MTAGNGASPPSRALRGLKLTLQLLATAVVTWFILKAVGVNLEEFRALDLSQWNVHWGLLAVSSMVLLAGYLYSAALWGIMVKEMGGPEVGLVTSLRVFFTANLGRYLPGKVWQLAGMAYLAQREGVRPATATGAALLGQAFSLAGATLVGLGVLLGSGWGPRLGGGWTMAILLVLLLAFTFPAVLRRLLGLWFRLARSDVPGGFRPDDAFGIRWMGLYALGWILQGGAFLVLVWSMGLELGILHGIPAYPAAYVLGYVAIFAPAGLGVREATLVVFLQPFLGTGAAAVAVVARLWTTALELLPALTLAGGYLRTPSEEEGEGTGG